MTIRSETLISRSDILTLAEYTLLGALLAGCKPFEWIDSFPKAATSPDGLAFGETSVFSNPENLIGARGVETTYFGKNQTGRVIKITPKAFQSGTYYPKHYDQLDTTGTGRDTLSQFEEAHKKLDSVIIIQKLNTLTAQYETVTLPTSQGVLATVHKALAALGIDRANLTLEQRKELTKLLLDDGPESAQKQYPDKSRLVAFALSIVNNQVLRAGVDFDTWNTRTSQAAIILDTLPNNIQMPEDLPITVYADLLTISDLPDSPRFTPSTSDQIDRFSLASGQLSNATFVHKLSKEGQEAKEALIARHETIPLRNMQVFAVVREDQNLPKDGGEYQKFAYVYARYKDNHGQLPKANGLDHSHLIAKIPYADLMPAIISGVIEQAQGIVNIDEAVKFFGIDTQAKPFMYEGPVTEYLTIKPENLSLIEIPNNLVGKYKARLAWGLPFTTQNGTPRVLIINPMARDAYGVNNMQIDANSTCTIVPNANELVAQGHTTLDTFGALTAYETYLLMLMGMYDTTIPYSTLISKNPKLLEIMSSLFMYSVGTDSKISEWNFGVATERTEIAHLSQRDLGIYLALMDKAEEAFKEQLQAKVPTINSVEYNFELVADPIQELTPTGLYLERGEAVPVSAILPFKIGGHRWAIIGPKITTTPYEPTQTGPEKILAAIKSMLISETGSCYLVRLDDDNGETTKVVTLDPDDQLFKTAMAVGWSAAIVTALVNPGLAGFTVMLPGLLLRRLILGVAL